MRKIIYLSSILFSLLLANCTQSQTKDSPSKNETKISGIKYPDPQKVSENASFPIKLSEGEWKQRLTPQQYYILREKGTEIAGTGKLDHLLIRA